MLTSPCLQHPTGLKFYEFKLFPEDSPVGAHAGGGSGAQLHGAGRVQHRCGIPLGLPRPKGNYQAILHITVITIISDLSHSE